MKMKISIAGLIEPLARRRTGQADDELLAIALLINVDVSNLTKNGENRVVEFW